MNDFLGWMWNTNAYVTVVLSGIVGLLALAAIFSALGFGRDLGAAFAKGWRQERPKRPTT